MALLGTALLATTADAAQTAFPRSYNPETAAGYTNTYSTNETLSPQCPNALAATPGSDPASKVLNGALNNAASFQPGGTVHFIYKDNPHPNGGTQNFTIQDCVVTYPAGTFGPGQVDPATGVVTGYAKSDLKGGTQIDGASLSGISSSIDNIYYSWTSPTSLTVGSFVCFFARDIRNNHGGGGNRKVPPTCYEVPGPPQPPKPKADVPPSIFVGYADDLHSMAAPLTPWQGSGPTVVYVGCTDGAANCGELDAGAIRIDNPSTNSNPLTLTASTVTIGACTFDAWTTATSLLKTVGPGQQMILTQTGQLGPAMPAPCRDAINPIYWPFNNFDSSERAGDNGGFNGGTLSFNCDASTGATPMIHLEFNGGSANAANGGVTVNATDVDKVLNTGGIDSQACFGVNEARPWSTAALPTTP